jgi:hypothetical protein
VSAEEGQGGDKGGAAGGAGAVGEGGDDEEEEEEEAATATSRLPPSSSPAPSFNSLVMATPLIFILSRFHPKSLITALPEEAGDTPPWSVFHVVMPMMDTASRAMPRLERAHRVGAITRWFFTGGNT